MGGCGCCRGARGRVSSEAAAAPRAVIKQRRRLLQGVRLFIEHSCRFLFCADGAHRVNTAANMRSVSAR